MKHLNIFLIILVFGMSTAKGQQYITKPGLDKFVGMWQYINGTDTITFRISTRYVGTPSHQVKNILGYYKYKSGNTIVRDNLANYLETPSNDFAGSFPYGNSLDSINFFGRDVLKRKNDEGILTINTTQNQLKYIRIPNLSGGGTVLYANGQAPLSGFTLPDILVLNKVVMEEEELKMAN